MRCRDFQQNHLAFVDDTLSAVDTTAMREHLEACSRCARRDAAVRRGLMLARSLPRVQCSADFSSRLEARLRELGPVNRHAAGPLAASRRASVARFSMLAAGVFGLAALAGFAMLRTPVTPTVRMAPVVASTPEPMPQPVLAYEPVAPAVVTPVYVASFISGMPVLPAVTAAGNASARMATVQLQQASLSSRDPR
ncbi:MAG: zf-HC2 domain-containing protein [Gemmatimonadaceae bacterium]